MADIPGSNGIANPTPQIGRPPANPEDAGKPPQPKGQLDPSTGKPTAEAKPSLGDIAKETAKRMLKHKQKDGTEIEVDEEEAVQTYLQRKEHQRAADKLFKQGQAARKQAEEFISMMRDPQKFFDVAQKLGHDPRKLTEEYLASKLEEELMDPKDRELKQLRTQLKTREEIDQAEKRAAEERVHSELKQKFADDYNKQFVEALEGSGLKPTKSLVASMAKYIQRAAQLGYKMTAQEASKMVKEDVKTAVQSIIGESDGDILIGLLGDGVANKIRKFDTSRVKDPNQFLKTPGMEEQGERDQGGRFKSKTVKRMTPQEWRKFNQGF